MNPVNSTSTNASAVQYSVQGQPPGTMIYVASAPQQSPRMYDNYNSKQSQALGVTMIVAGISFSLLYVVVMIMYGISSTACYCIFDGIWIVLNGSFGVCAAKNKTPCKIHTFMVLCILSAIGSTIVLIMVIFAIIIYVVHGIPCELIQEYADAFSTASCQTIIAVDFVHTTLAVIITVVTYWGSIICCKVECCCTGNQRRQIIAHPEFIPMQGVQQVVIPMQGTQQMVVYNPAHQPEQLHGGQSSQYAGIYPAPIYPGYPAPATMDTMGATSKPVYDHSMYAPPSYDEAKHPL